MSAEDIDEIINTMQSIFEQFSLITAKIPPDRIMRLVPKYHGQSTFNVKIFK